jgi:hypothetical protein
MMIPNLIWLSFFEKNRSWRMFNRTEVRLTPDYHKRFALPSRTMKSEGHHRVSALERHSAGAGIERAFAAGGEGQL